MLRVDVDGAVLRIALNRPDVRNAFNDELIGQLADAFQSGPPSVRTIVLSGEGKVFCAGGDLEWMRRMGGYSHDENVADATRLALLFQSIQRAPQLVIARVHGAVFGGGCGLVAAADVAIAAEGTRFSFSEAKLGMIPATISTVVTPKIGVGAARALYATAEVFGAERALAIGLIHDVVPESELDGAVEAMIDQTLANGPGAVAASKQLALDYPITLEESARRLAETRAGAEAQEGLAAFLEKRPASYVVKR